MGIPPCPRRIYTPMHGAGFQGRADIAEILHAHGVEIDHRHTDGSTPLQRACWGREPRHSQTVELMLRAGASLEGISEGSNPATRQIIADWRKMSKWNFGNKEL